LRGLRFVSCLAVAVATVCAFAFPPVPKESAKALKVTKGRPFTDGAVFINGRFIDPPYVVERWGTGIRINGKKVTGQIVDWNEFVKTQAGVKMEPVDAPAAEPVASAPATPAPQPVAEEVDISAGSLDDLFDDDPKPASPTAARSAVAAKPAAVSKPKVAVPKLTYEGKFVHNATTKRLLEQINAARTEADRILRSGGFIFFGDQYSRVTGDDRALRTMMAKLPELMQRATTLEAFRAEVRAANLVYLNEVLCEDLFRNRFCYRQLQEYRQKLENERKWKTMLDDVKQPLF